MARDGLNAEIARQRQAELTRAAERHWDGAGAPGRPRIVRARAHEAVTIRLAAAEDRRALDLLARVHGAVARLSRAILTR
jgi:hypothetical protein